MLAKIVEKSVSHFYVCFHYRKKYMIGRIDFISIFVMVKTVYFNPSPPSVPIWHRLEKISYERRDYESVDEKSLSS